MIEPTSWIAALLLGLFGSSHCLVMCGGIGAAVAIRRPSHLIGSDRSVCTPQVQQSASHIFLFNLGRILSYGLIGIIFGGLGLIVAELHQTLLPILRTLAGLLLIGMGLYIGRWSLWLSHLEKLGQGFWKNRIQPLASRLLGQQSTKSILILGALWGWLPCGLIYSTLAWTATSSSPLESGLLMVIFGLGTLPAMLAIGFSAASFLSFLRHQLVRQCAGALLISYGVWTIFSGTVGPHLLH